MLTNFECFSTSDSFKVLYYRCFYYIPFINSKKLKAGGKCQQSCPINAVPVYRVVTQSVAQEMY